MEKEKTTWKTFKNVIRWFDFSGDSFTFKYRDQDKLSTLSAGIIYIIFFVLALAYFISIYIPFRNHEIFKLQYYLMKADENEDITLNNSATTFAFGLTNEEKNPEYNITDLFNLTIEYTIKVTGKNKINETLEPINCDISDFIGIEKDSKLWENIINLNCLNKTDLERSPKGIFTDSFFSYYTISVQSKYKNNETHNKIIDDYLARYDCKLQIYYTDIRLNLNNFKEPFTYIINSMFLQLNPSLIQKKNIYYMNYYLENDTRLFQLNINNDDSRIETGLSKVEDYAVYKGVNRTFKQYKDICNYAKVYIRADNSKIIIKRNYQDLLEFYAEKSSLWLSIYWIFGFLFSLYDRENASHSISKKLFYFEGIKDNKFNKFKELKEIKELINKIEESQKNEPNVKVHVSPYTTRNSATSKTLNNNYTRKNSKASLNTDLERIQKEQNKIEKLVNYDNYNLLEMIGSQKLFF